jgi:hypothetical protein
VLHLADLLEEQVVLIPADGQAVADAIADTARSMDRALPLTFLRHLGNDDVLHRGPEQGGALIVVMGIWSGMPPALLATVRARRSCAVSGRCPECGTCVDLGEGQFAHESQCSVSDDRLGAALAAWLHQVGLFARGRRLLEVPL